MLYRHGDVLIERISALPTATPRPGHTLAHGEVTGHSHRFRDPHSVQLYQHGATTYLRVLNDTADLIHEEHRTITLPRGDYRFWMQREYSPEAIRRVID
ncbi:hypothetical protein [Deinococcus maricopensis]|uniref:Uncharacterized protein n=1 Tax=Deinococcus maricopensis (strain DSM 21211 / LMG 22137 / NRRL B-23946 / LB-34) TaxID=709986 RepID=E8U322_DEIML|nr:hypothetical protein [Deinococcus maricopensis]ADV65760.1 hypothetical protein Deima_0096 [Deinococcus maricopensis DSM 21211]